MCRKIQVRRMGSDLRTRVVRARLGNRARGEPLRGDEMLLRFRHGPLMALVNKGLKKNAENKLQSERLLKRSLR